MEAHAAVTDAESACAVVSVAPAAVAPVAGWASGPLGVVQAADREIARQTAVQARAVAEFAASRPASVDRPPGEPGAMSADRRAARPAVLAGVSEWAAQELVVALSITSRAAETLLTRSLTLVHRLPRTLAALESGALQVGQLWPLLEKVAPIADPKVRGEVEADLLAWAAGRVTTPAQLGAKARRMVLARDARGAAQRLTAALRRRGAMWIRPDETDGMAVLSVLLTVPEAAALLDALGRYADALEDDVAVNGLDGAADGPGASAAGPDGTDNAGAADAAAVVPRTRAQKMADVLLDLVLRANESELPPVRGQLTLVAPVATMAGGDRPGEVDGQPVPAEMVRSLARAFGLMPAGDSTEPPAGTDPAVPSPAPVTSNPASPNPASAGRGLLRRCRRRRRAARPRAVVGRGRGPGAGPGMGWRGGATAGGAGAVLAAAAGLGNRGGPRGGRHRTHPTPRAPIPRLPIVGLTSTSAPILGCPAGGVRRIGRWTRWGRRC